MTPEIDSDAVKAIADSYGLDAEKLDKTLRQLVDSKAGGYEVAERQAVGPGEKELKILLRKMKKHACALRKTLDEVPVMTGFHAESGVGKRSIILNLRQRKKLMQERKNAGRP